MFTFTLFLPEGRAGVAWEPSNKMILFLPPRKIKCLSFHPLIYSLNLLFVYPSLSLSFKALKVGYGDSGKTDGKLTAASLMFQQFKQLLFCMSVKLGL
jgi:hypothetical protein